MRAQFRSKNPSVSTQPPLKPGPGVNMAATVEDENSTEGREDREGASARPQPSNSRNGHSLSEREEHKIDCSAGEHDWEKTDLVSGANTNYQCRACKVKGIRYGFSWPPVVKGKTPRSARSSTSSTAARSASGYAPDDPTVMGRADAAIESAVAHVKKQGAKGLKARGFDPVQDVPLEEFVEKGPRRTTDDLSVSPEGVLSAKNARDPFGFEQVVAVAELITVRIEQLREHPQNPRKGFGEESLRELVDSIRAHGILTPLIVRPWTDPNLKAETALFGAPKAGQTDSHGRPATYEVLAGHRRLRAAYGACLKQVPVLVRSLSDHQATEVLLLDNLQREGLSALEEGEGFRAAIDSGQFTVESLMARINKSRRHIFNRLGLVKLPAEVKEALRAGKIDHTKALVLGRVPDEKKRAEFLEGCIDDHEEGDGDGWSIRDLENQISQFRSLYAELENAPWELDAIFSLTEFPKLQCETCQACPHRMANRPEFREDRDKYSANTCTLPKCYHAKETAYGKSECARDGVQWFGKKPGSFDWNGKLRGPDHGQLNFVSPTWKPAGSTKTWRQLFMAEAPSAPGGTRPKLHWLGKIADGNWKLHEVIAAEMALALATELGLTKAVAELSRQPKAKVESSGQRDWQAEQREREKREAPYKAVWEEAWPLVQKAITEKTALEFLRTLVAASHSENSSKWSLAQIAMYLVETEIYSPVQSHGNNKTEFAVFPLALAKVAKVDLEGLLKAELEAVGEKDSQKSAKAAKKGKR